MLIAKGDLSPSAKLSYSLKQNEDVSTTVDQREQEEIKATVTWPIFDGGKKIRKMLLNFHPIITGRSGNV
mgnify:CR=1 FL=1